jgi:hypothetical protein
VLTALIAEVNMEVQMTRTLKLSLTSSVNSGNSFKHSKKVVTSRAKSSSSAGKLSGVKFPCTIGLATFAGVFCPRRRDWLSRMRFLISSTLFSSRWSRWILRGKRSAAFSRKRKRTWVRRSRRWNAEDSMPTEDPSCLTAFAKPRS